MRRLHDVLNTRYRDIRDDRSGPVFFIEHGEAPDELLKVARDGLSSYNDLPSSEAWWREHHLVLLAAAAEVGYSYRGAGTDFWPMLERALGVRIPTTGRTQLIDNFEGAASRLRGATPGDTPWERAFRLIAWPITHALLPLEFHRPLALAMSRLNALVSLGRDDALLKGLAMAASASTKRFDALLAQPFTAGMVRALLEGSDAPFSDEIEQRIRRAIALDERASRDVKVAALRRREGARRGRGHARRGELRLRMRGDTWRLEVMFPSADHERYYELTSALRARRYAPKLLGVCAPVPAERLLFGKFFELKVRELPAEDATLLGDLRELGFDRELRKELESLELELPDELLFAISSAGDTAAMRTSPRLTLDKKYVLLTTKRRRAGAPDAQLGPWSVYALDAAAIEDADVLRVMGRTLYRGISLYRVGAPALEPRSSTIHHLKGDVWYISPKRSYEEGLIVEHGGRRLPLRNGEVVRVVTSDDATLRVRGDGVTEGVDFIMASEARPRLPICAVIQKSVSTSTQGFLSGEFVFTIEGVASLTGLEALLELRVGGDSYRVVTSLPPLPVTYSSNAQWVRALFDDEAVYNWMLRAPTLSLRISVGALCELNVTLERRLSACWWEGRELMSEEGARPIGVVSLGTPHAAPRALEELEGLTSAHLLAPFELDEERYGARAAMTTLCLAPGRALLNEHIEKPPLERDHAALEELVAARLRWALAETRSVTGEYYRAQALQHIDAWIVELCCGAAWAKRERALFFGGPWRALERALIDMEDSLNIDASDYIGSSAREREVLTRLAINEMRRKLPELWIDGEVITEELCEALDEASLLAYERFADQLQARGESARAEILRDADPGASPDDWCAVIEQVRAQQSLPALARALLPTDTVAWMMAPRPLEMTTSDLAVELERWARAASRGLTGARPPRASSFRALLCVWLEPAAAAESGWRECLDLLRADRVIARAVRYLVLRRVMSARGER